MDKIYNITEEASKFKAVAKVSDGSYNVAWDYNEISEGMMNKNGKPVGTSVPTGKASWKLCKFQHKPSFREIREMTDRYYNKIVEKRITSGFTWNGYEVPLTMTDQTNFKRDYDLAMQTNGAVMPGAVKFYKNGVTTYYTFNSLEEFTTFFIAMAEWIKKCVEDGRKLKDSVSEDIYAV